MNNLKKQWHICLILPIMLVSACSSAFVSAASTSEEPTTLQVQRLNTEPENHYLPLSARTITNQQAVQRLYRAMQALPHFSIPNPPGWLSCLRETGIKYQLIFLHEPTFNQEAFYAPSGCPSIRIEKNDLRAPDKPFARLFAQTVGIAENALVPVPLFSCTIRSLCPSPTP